jgi:hypothetical protein
MGAAGRSAFLSRITLSVRPEWKGRGIVSDDHAELTEWRRFFHYDPELDVESRIAGKPREISILQDVIGRLEDAVKYVEGLYERHDADERLGPEIAVLASRFVYSVYYRLGWWSGESPLAGKPRNLRLASLAISGLLDDAREKLAVRWSATYSAERDDGMRNSLQTEIDNEEARLVAADGLEQPPPAEAVPKPQAGQPGAETPAVVLGGPREPPIVRGQEKPVLTPARYKVVRTLVDASPKSLSKDQLDDKSGHTDARKILKDLADSDPDWAAVIHFSGPSRQGYWIG